MNEDRVSPIQLWSNYTKHNAREWLGFWTRWDLSTGKVSDCFDSIRHIQLVDESRMHHHNTFIYEDGSTKDKGPMNGPWEYLRERDCDGEGLRHPSSRTSGTNARAFFFDNGGGVWTIMEVKDDANFFNETFFPRGEIRFSAGLFYVQNKAARISFIREDIRGRPSLYWSKETDFKGDFHVTGKFTGTEQTLTVQLQRNATTDCPWNRDYWVKENRSKEEDNTVIYLPDRVMISFPVKVDKSQSFHIKTCCHYTEGKENEIREQTIYYENGSFSHFKQGIYYPSKD